MQIIGHGYERFQAFVTCIFLFILICNLLGLIPGIAAAHHSAGGALWPGVSDFHLLQLLRSSKDQGLSGI